MSSAMAVRRGGASVIGPQRVAVLVSEGCATKAVTEPVSALVHACEQRNIKRLAFLSPYIESVSAKLRDVLSEERHRDTGFWFIQRS